MIHRIVATAAVGLVVATGAAHGQETGDPEAGQKVFNSCRACHTLDPGVNRVGPTLHGLFGREAGAVEGFRYSPAMAQSGIVWDEATLATFLADPRGTVKGTKMVFAGVKDPKQLADLIAYLKDATQ